jgi:hypothetical protein
MGHFAGTLRSHWPRLVLELIVLFIGITVSLAANEWRQAIGRRDEERRALTGLRDDLRSDSAYLAGRLAVSDRMVDAYGRLLAPAADAPPPDSADLYMDAAITYLGFARRDNTYEALKQTGRTDLVGDEVLRGMVINLYNRVYLNATEWDAINRQFVLERMIPYLDQEGPYVETAFADGAATGFAAVYAAVRGDDRFRNLMRTNRLFKEAQRSVYQLVLREVSHVLAAVEAELGEARAPAARDGAPSARNGAPSARNGAPSAGDAAVAPPQQP